MRLSAFISCGLDCGAACRRAQSLYCATRASPNSPSISDSPTQSRGKQASRQCVDVEWVPRAAPDLTQGFDLVGQKTAAMIDGNLACRRQTERRRNRVIAPYALRDRAVCSVFRRASETPIYRIEKSPKLACRQGAYSVISATELVVRRGHELDPVLRAIDKSMRIVAG